MNAPARPATLAPPPLHAIALATLAQGAAPGGDGVEQAWLHTQRVLCNHQPGLAFERWAALAPDADARLQRLAGGLALSPAEALAVAVAAAVETDGMLARVLAWLQAPVGGSRPTVGLIDQIARALGIARAPAAIANGAARACGVLQFDGESRLLIETGLKVPLPIAMALQNEPSQWPQIRPISLDATVLADSVRDAAASRARGLGTSLRALAVRSGHPRRAQAAAAHIAAALGRTAMLVADTPPAGLGPWLSLTNAIPIHCAELAPGETRRLPELPGYRDPILIATGPDGGFEWEGDTVSSWHVPVPTAHERERHWRDQLGDAGPLVGVATMLGRAHRYDAAQIRALGRLARFYADVEGAAAPSRKHVVQAARSGAAGELGSLAELIVEAIPDDALIAPAALRDALAAFLQRCLVRESLADRLGTAARTRYRPGVRALFTGPSGTGKTLAAGWLATRLGLPMYRVDVAAVTSKYIGETEKNLAQLFARAEHTEAVLLFDEADALFGKRTDIKESNDRFANAQTNYLLQRIESFDGIAILTSNSRSRFDSAFTRRLDAIIEFPAPAPEERRALWCAHLGADHALSVSEVNRLAGLCDLAGGHIRNVVLHAAAGAADCGRPIEYADLLAGVVQEYRKLGKQVPAGLGAGEAA